MGPHPSLNRYMRVAGTAIAVLAAACLLAPTAGAVLVHSGKHRPFGVVPVRGVRPSSIAGSVAKSSSNASTDTGTVTYHGGPVLHGSTPYLVFWDPSNGGTGLTTADRSLFDQYFADVAAASGASSDVYGIDRQYTDSTGFANYQQVWSNSHAIVDTHAYPTSGQCRPTEVYGETTCLTDAQIQAEIGRLIAADNLPTGTSGNAPIYFVVTPPTVNSCTSFGCADQQFCGYHSSFTDNGANVVYADIPTVLAANNPKACQDDGTPEVQSPNRDPLADVALKYVSHEDNEAITDPLGTGWWDPLSGNEIADNCNQTGSFNPPGGTNPNAFLPSLGGTESAGTLWNQLINGDHYYLQRVWSNGDGNCVMHPISHPLTAAFTAPTVVSTGQSVSFNSSSSSSAVGVSSTTWNFGDGGSSFSRGGPASATHTYTTPGTYQATLTLVDNSGNLATTSETITTPIPSFTADPSSPQAGTSVSFDASGSSEPGGSISSYSWNFGDGSTSTLQTPNHTYAQPGNYKVSLTVTDNTGHTATITRTVSVHGVPTAAFTVTTKNPQAGPPASVSFNGSASSEPFGSLTYSWDFGDSSAPGTGVTTSHTYTQAGTYTVTLTVTDTSGNTATASQQITVLGAPTAAFSTAPTFPQPDTQVTFNGSGSTDVGSSITAYTWNFGDGTPSTMGASVTHTYLSPGAYQVSLTITDASGATNTATHTVDVNGPPIASFREATANPVAGSPVSFDGSGSSELFGSIVSYIWNFGDGSPPGSGRTPSHTYARAGTYTVSLTVTDQSGTTDTTTHSVTVASVLKAVIIAGTAQPLTATLSGASSTDIGSTITSYRWTFGDGSISTAQSPSHTYASPGIYTVSLTITDASGATDTTSRGITIHGPPSAAVAVNTGRPAAGSPVVFSGADSSEPFGSISSYSWNFGDGSTSTAQSPSHTYSGAGSYTVTLTVSDPFGNTARASRTIMVVSVPKAVIALRTANPVAGIPVLLSGSASSDAGSTISSYSWSFGNGSAGSGASVSHRYSKPGTYTVTLRIADATGASAATSTTARVKSPAITRVSVKKGTKVERVTLTISGAGTLRLGSRKFKIRRPEKFVLTVRPSTAQVASIAAHRRVTITLKLKFVPTFGKASGRTVVIKLRR